MRRSPTSMRGLEALGRVRLSRHVYLRDCLYSEIAAIHGLRNIPDDPDLAIAAGTRLCTDLLDPMFETFGHVAIRSAYRSSEVNGLGAAQGLNCSRNEATYAAHIWDRRDAQGRMGATACVVVPWFADQYDHGRDWRDLAWWIHDHLAYSSLWFHPKLCAVNIQWREEPERTISSYIAPKGRLLAPGAEPPETPAARRARYADFPPFRKGIAHAA